MVQLVMDEWTTNEDILDHDIEAERNELWLDEQIDRLREQQREDVWDMEAKMMKDFDAQMKHGQRFMQSLD